MYMCLLDCIFGFFFGGRDLGPGFGLQWLGYGFGLQRLRCGFGTSLRFSYWLAGGFEVFVFVAWFSNLIMVYFG